MEGLIAAMPEDRRHLWSMRWDKAAAEWLVTVNNSRVLEEELKAISARGVLQEIAAEDHGLTLYVCPLD